MLTVGPGHLVAGRYRLLSQIGGGGMGTVWLGRDELLGRQVAVKQVLPPAGTDPELEDQQRQRALREGRIAARLSHPHAISVYDVALEAGSPWLVMEYLPSRSLAQVLYEDGLLRVDQVAQIGAQLADALAATHAAGIVHRDVKPANVLIGQGAKVQGLVKITDFGISHASGDVTLTQTGQITGTPAFLAPEVAQGAEMSPASDVFSLGATLYTCLEGQPPFGMDDNALRLLHRVAIGEVREPARAGSLAGPLMRMLDADPAARPTMEQVRDELARLAAGRDGDPTTVLLARADLHPGPRGTARLPDPAAVGGRTPVAPLPAVAPPEDPPAPEPAPAPRPAPEPAPAPPPRPAAGPRTAVQPRATPSRPAAAAPRRRRRPALLAGLLVLLLLAGGGIAWLVATSGDAGDPAAGPTTSAAPTSDAEEESPPAEEPVAEPTEPSTPPPSSSEPPPSSESPSPAATDEDAVRAFLQDYHELVLTDPGAAYARTGPTLRSTISEGNYAAFWGRFSDVVVSDVQVDLASLTATATVEFAYADGGRETEQHLFTFVEQDGQLLLDSDVAQ
ncbi:serine/threonine-protein kinase [Blastococcus sp. SYSU D00820]